MDLFTEIEHADWEKYYLQTWKTLYPTALMCNSTTDAFHNLWDLIERLYKRRVILKNDE